MRRLCPSHPPCGFARCSPASIYMITDRQVDRVARALERIADGIDALRPSAGAERCIAPNDLDRALARRVLQSGGVDAPTDGGLLTKAEAALALRMSVRSFERHVQPHVERVWSGTRHLFKGEELKRWAAEHKVGPSDATHARGSTSRGSEFRGAGTADPRVQQIAQWLRRKRRGSTAR